MKLELSLNEKLAAKNQHLQELKDKLKKKSGNSIPSIVQSLDDYVQSNPIKPSELLHYSAKVKEVEHEGQKNLISVKLNFLISDSKYLEM